MQELEENFKKNGGSFEKYKIGDLFESFTGDVDIQNKDLTESGEYFINSGVTNCGIKGNVKRVAKLFPANTLTVDFFGNTYYRDFSYKLATHNHVFSLSSSVLKNRAVGLYISSAFSYLTKKYSYNTMLTRPQMNEEYIVLPTIDNELAFDYMQEYVRELEQEYVRELDAYLKATGLDNYELTEEENKVLTNETEMISVPVESLFGTPIRPKNILSKLNLVDNGKFPVYSSDTTNNGIIGYCNQEDFITSNTINSYIVFGDHTRTFNIARTSFSVADNVKVLADTNNFSDEVLLYIFTIWKKHIPNYGYARHWKYAKEAKLDLPSLNCNIDSKYMETYIRAIEKLVIKDVVDWKNKEIETAKEVISQN